MEFVGVMHEFAGHAKIYQEKLICQLAGTASASGEAARDAMFPYMKNRGRVASSGRTLMVLTAVAATAGCGPRTSVVETAQVRERDEDATVLVFDREVDGIPACPWEVLGTVAVDEGWLEDDGEIEEVRRAAARMGGHAVMVEGPASEEARVLRFFDPLCNPVRD